jgi:hypothetical protein
MYHMQIGMWSKVGYMRIKLDMNKAYNRVEWAFLEVVMQKLGFSDLWISWIMTCVRSASYSMLVNRNPMGKIIPSRGIRQGDPISPYLFLLCAEVFSSPLHHAGQNGVITRVPTSKRGPRISHLFFC